MNRKLEKLLLKITAWLLFFKKEKEYGGKKFNFKKFYLMSKGFCSGHPIPWDYTNNKYSDYVSDLENIKMAYINYPYGRLLRDKLVFSNFFNTYFRTPDCYCIIDKGKLIPANSNVYIDSFSSLIDLAEKRKLIAKPRLGTAGTGIILIECDNHSGLLINKKPTVREDLIKFLSTLDLYIVTEHIEQSKFAGSFFPGTANTVRLTTLFNEDTKNSFVPYSFMRFGRKHSIPADNISQGGIFSMIDVNNGELSEAFEIVDNQKPIIHTHHPDTDTLIKGVKIPGWNNLTEFFIKTGNLLMPIIKIVGWDIILTEDSFVVVEGNNGPNLYNNQGAGYPLGKIPEVNNFLKYHRIR
jgi:hypothetical protein